MIEIKFFGKEIFSWGEPKVLDESLEYKTKKRVLPLMPGGRVSQVNITDFSFDTLSKGLKMVKPAFLFEAIPVIRKLSIVNPNVSQALDNIVSLGNTGHRIKFDDAVPTEQVTLMKRHLDRKKLDWSEGTAGMDGLVNKMIAQVMIGGALSNEWIPQMDLRGIKKVALINPEEIRFGYSKKDQKYKTFQKPPNAITLNDPSRDYIELNENTYKYYALNGDQELPYGIPPYLAALDSVKTQGHMNDNIKFIIELMGIIGFLEVLISSPEMQHDENEKEYKAELEKLLDDAKDRVQKGFRDGVIVGVEEDHTFKFHSVTKDTRGATELFQQNELQFMSALKQDASLMGRAYGTSETQITVVFTKLLSQLKNIQNLVKRNLEFGYALELRLAGFDFNTITVEFKRSTILDELKFQQAEEIKIRNCNAMYLDGIISQEQYADILGFDAPDLPKPRFIRGQVQTEEEARKKNEENKDKSDRKGTEKKNEPSKSSKN